MINTDPAAWPGGHLQLWMNTWWWFATDELLAVIGLCLIVITVCLMVTCARRRFR